ncbi:MAG TPA: peptidoglycan-associated lipoprotein Pal [Bdellovibrionota bacterium]|jgi:peptidoglycan-associated lipoprotein|nr:peptidoglycan-associated lipoprotein Pal [Bdellovibrionota bacterium]
MKVSAKQRATAGLSGLFLVFGLAILATGTVGCGDKTKKPDQMTADADLSGGKDSDSGGNGMQTVNFPYDSYTLTADAKDKLNHNAQMMKDKSSLQIQIEGHCDERGGIQYNLALGEKRANATRKYMIDAGVKGDRITTISFGEERPLDPGHDEAAWAKNRRANFVTTSQ